MAQKAKMRELIKNFKKTELPIMTKSEDDKNAKIAKVANGQIDQKWPKKPKR